jgi:alpha-D-ribose 1-methylphosphonate 5-triphosphate diphosphatase PhnM
MREDSLAKNEELFRNVNERIETVSQTVPQDDTMMEYLCECDRPECYDRVKATREEYESVRAESTHFIVLPGHDDPTVEHVAFSNERFLIVEKQGAAAEDAKESDPRDHS